MFWDVRTLTADCTGHPLRITSARNDTNATRELRVFMGTLLHWYYCIVRELPTVVYTRTSCSLPYSSGKSADLRAYRMNLRILNRANAHGYTHVEVGSQVARTV